MGLNNALEALTLSVWVPSKRKVEFVSLSLGR